MPASTTQSPVGQAQRGQAAPASATTHYATARIGNEVQWNMLGLFRTVHLGGCSKKRFRSPLCAQEGQMQGN